jgi:protein-L-isoaspartate(D-aspartate) O-methyltransferase
VEKKKVKDREIYEFFKKLDRALFVDDDQKYFANYDSPLPIGFEQTVSQPSLVCDMTCSLQLESNSKVLEIGTGSGYQTAFLSEFSFEVFTVERIEALALKAKKTLTSLGYHNIKFRIGDGSLGWKEYAPFDRIIVTAAASVIPDTLVEQLSPGGRMIVPVGPVMVQELLLIIKDKRNNISRESLGGVRFVELKGKYGW